MVTLLPGEATQPIIRRIWLVRHGLTAWNTAQRFCGQSNVPLLSSGRVQARWLARRLHTTTLVACYSSDLSRAYETAEIIAGSGTPPLPIQALAAWREIHFGAWEGLTYAEIVARFPAALDFFRGSLEAAPPAGESLLQLRQRVLEGLRLLTEACRTLPAGDILLVSHGGPLRVLLSCVLELPLERQWQFALDPGSLSALDLLLAQDQGPLPSGVLSLLNLCRSTAAGPWSRARAATKAVDA